jgi:hypothetical protein
VHKKDTAGEKAGSTPFASKNASARMDSTVSRQQAYKHKFVAKIANPMPTAPSMDAKENALIPAPAPKCA